MSQNDNPNPPSNIPTNAPSNPASFESSTTNDSSSLDKMSITPLGAGQEVGRSSILVSYKNKNILLDCGLHPAHSGLAALPFFDNIDPSTVDIILLTHFHIDHAAALPYFMQRTTFKGRVFMTHPTKAIFKWLLSDYVKVSNLAVDDMLYDEKDLIASFEKIETVDFHQEVSVDGIKFTPYNAGHVLGAAMYLIEIAGVRVLYTGDYSREEDRHLMAAEVPPPHPSGTPPDILICESTYGVQHHQSRSERERIFTGTVKEVVERGGRCLIPVFALGRAQELLLILDEFWQENPNLHNIPIYYASSLAKKCMTVYQTFSNMMNHHIREASKTSNPFHFKHISNLKSMSHFDDVGPCVMMASPGMLQNGQSRELLELWCGDAKNGVIIPGYVVEGTLGKLILSLPKEIQSMAGPKLPLRLSIEYVSFSAHVDFPQNSEFIDTVGAPNLVLVHGDQNEMGRLKSALTSRYQDRPDKIHIHTPKNCESVEFFFCGEKLARVLGSLAKTAPEANSRVEGVLVGKDFSYQIVNPRDLPEFTDLLVSSIKQKLHIPYSAPFSLIKWHLDQLYGKVLFKNVEDNDFYIVFNTVSITVFPRKLVLEWEGNFVNDMIADSCVAVIMQAESSPASVKATRVKCSHSHPTEEVKSESKKVKTEHTEIVAAECLDVKIEDNDTSENVIQIHEEETKPDEYVELGTGFFKSQFGESVRATENGWIVTIDEEDVNIVLRRGIPLVVESVNEELNQRVKGVASRIKKTLEPVAETWKYSQ